MSSVLCPTQNCSVALGKLDSQAMLLVKNPSTNAGDERDVVLILGCKDPLEDGMATHSNILAWRIPWTEEPGGL